MNVVIDLEGEEWKEQNRVYFDKVNEKEATRGYMITS